MNMQCKNKNRGFTLAEMAIVVVIGSLLLMAGVQVLTTQMESAAYSATRFKQEAIKQAMITYLGNNKRLPCPDTRNGNGPGALLFTTAARPDGIENRATAGVVTSNCAATFGVLPYATLGLTRDAALDGWNNLFSYHLTTAPNWAVTASFADTNVGGLTINDRTPAGAVLLLTSQAVTVVVSHGKNGTGAYTIKGTRAVLPVAGTHPDEYENTNAVANSVYYKREYTNNSAAIGGSFDDLVMPIMANEMIAPLRRDGTLKNMGTSLSQQMDTINNAIVGYMMGAGCNTPPNITGLGLSVTDPWATTIVYTSSYTTPPVTNKLTASDINLVPAGNAATVAFILTSYGPNRAAGGGDDVVQNMTVGQLRGLLGSAYATRCP